MTSGYDAYIADRYHQECLALLIPMLDDSTAALDEALFATTVVLRLYEEMSGECGRPESKKRDRGKERQNNTRSYSALGWARLRKSSDGIAHFSARRNESS